MQSSAEDRLIRELAALPELVPPPDAAPRVLAAMRAAADASGTRHRTSIMAIAAAAGIAATALLVWQLWLPPTERVPTVVTETPSDASRAGTDAHFLNGSPEISASADDYFALIEQSARLERALVSLPAQRNVMRASTAGTIATLEDSIARIDAQLTLATAGGAEPQYRTELWRERVDVMNALLQVRYANSQAFSY